MATINGDNDDNTLDGTLGGDIIRAYDGDDVLNGLNGNEVLFGGDD